MFTIRCMYIFEVFIMRGFTVILKTRNWALNSRVIEQLMITQIQFKVGMASIVDKSINFH